MNSAYFTLFSLLLAMFSLQGCGGSSSSDASETNQDQPRDLTVFPQSLAVTSPTEVENVDSLTRSAPRAISYHGYATQRIDQLLSGDTPLRDVFDIEQFYRLATNAQCFGPELEY
ncbi:MAG: hypothetical protein CO047_09625, partial [Piscirickettsiaceae bacterium CG_4_9_14_0_2_um_filter_44_546]